MALSDNNSNNADNGPKLTAAQIRLLKIVVIVSGIFLIAGFVGLSSVLVYKISTINNTQPATQLSQAPHSKVLLPKGAIVKSLSHTGNSIAILTSSQGKREIRVFELSTGKMLNRLEVQEE